MAAVHPTRPFFALPRAFFAALLIGPLLSGCLSSDSDNNNDGPTTGRINALGISGLTYQTASQSGKTDSKGQFQYYPGETLSLKVGDLLLAENVPAQKWVTLLEFFPDIRAQLTSPSIDDEGLRTHRGTEQQLIDRTHQSNLIRFLMALNWAGNPKDGEGIEIRDRVIQQLNAALPSLTSPIDFRASQSEFNASGSAPSPANQLLASICFYPEGSELCEDPSEVEDKIKSAIDRPENPEPGIEYKQDLQAKLSRILNAARTMGDVEPEDAKRYLSRELDSITTTLGKRFYLERHTANVPASDTRIQQFNIHRIGGSAELADIDAITTRPQDIVLHSYNAETASVEYFVGGPAGGESEIVTSFLPENTYRWVRKTLRVVID
ncbi:organic solvent ABC transporter permease [Marinobacter salexigens]|uniref:organic solvent ABC transporter permease n=1 Tax=Marinobacter salexigens TaxID=1925763 RepID=UPI000C289403|nr:organic solvent ABC transporter permease [Marinobacter salexigens]